MKPKIEIVLDDCFENGLSLGWNKAHKYVDDPTEEQIKAYMKHAIWDEIYERFDFEDKMNEDCS